MITEYQYQNFLKHCLLYWIYGKKSPHISSVSSHIPQAKKNYSLVDEFVASSHKTENLVCFILWERFQKIQIIQSCFEDIVFPTTAIFCGDHPDLYCPGVMQSLNVAKFCKIANSSMRSWFKNFSMILGIISVTPQMNTYSPSSFKSVNYWQ